MSSIRVTAPMFVAGKKGRIVFSVAPSKHLPLLIGRDFLTPARAVVDMGEKTLRVGTGVDDVVVSRAGHLALRLNPQDRTLGLRNSRCLSATSVQKASRSCLKNVAQLPHHDEHPRHCFVCSVPSDRCCVACSHPVCHDCSHKTLCTRCVFNVDDKNSCSNVSSSLVESDCVPAEVNIVEEQQNMWRRIKKGTKFQLDAGRRECFVVVIAASETPLCC